MDKVFILCFSQRGIKIADLIMNKFDNAHIEAYTPSKYIAKSLYFKTLYFKPYDKKLMKEFFEKGNYIIFIGAVGIAVRLIAPYIKDKSEDPAVIVIDERGSYVIPILSGHIGGANRFSEKISNIINATPIITTATDINDVFAVDTWATENNYSIINVEMVKEISSSLLMGKEVGIYSDFEILTANPLNIVKKDHGEIGICIGLNPNEKPFEKTLNLIPRCFHVGLGARKGIKGEDLDKFLRMVLDENKIPIESIRSISSIDLKKNEEGILYIKDKYGFKFHIYSKEELRKVEEKFQSSEFVKSKTGVGNVCESACYISSGYGEMILNKKKGSGMTIAIAKEDWKVEF